mgnify:CR=1 FL=1
MNKHPSCTYTWKATTRASLHLSEALAFLMRGNAYLEIVLLDEFDDHLESKESSRHMVEMVRSSGDHLSMFKADLVESIDLGEKVGNPYKGDFIALNENLLAEVWEQNLLTGCKDVVKKIGAEVKGDHLATARRFVLDVESLIRTTARVLEVFETASTFAEDGSLKRAIEDGEFPLQAIFAIHFSHFLSFMREYLVDSLVATEVVFSAKGKSLLAS